jgi:hypothetical protein
MARPAAGKGWSLNRSFVCRRKFRDLKTPGK